MITDQSIAHVSALLADPARLAILLALIDGRPRPAGELARMAGVKPSTASEHLSKLLGGELIAVEPRGRHRYYRIAGAHVASVIEQLGALAQPRPPSDYRLQAAARAVRHARACYDHLAGVLGIQVTATLTDRGVLLLNGDAFELTAEGTAFLESRLGIDVCAVRASRRQFAKACLDWTEREYHVAGALGCALLSCFFEFEWLERAERTRALRVTAAGRRGFQDVLGVDALGGKYD